MANPALSYIDDVEQGREVVGDDIRRAVARHTGWMKNQHRKDFPYFFDEDKAGKAITLFSRLRHGKGQWNGKPYQLMPWQAFIIWTVYGWYHKSDRARRLARTVYVKVARKNAKTEWLSGIGIIGFAVDNEPDAEVYWVATKKDQARIGWKRQKTMTEHLRKDSAMFAKICKTSAHRIYRTTGDGFVAYLGQDSHTEDGLNPYYSLVDEYHAHKTDAMRQVLTSGMGARKNPMEWIITTAGVNPQSPCAQFEKRCKEILRGMIQNDSVFPFIFDLDEGDDWENEKNWDKANPARKHIPSLLDFLRAEFHNARTLGKTAEINFKTKNLNFWTTVSETFIPDDVWMKGAAPILPELLRGKLCFGGLDLAATRDTTSLCLLFPPQPGLDKFYALWWYWLPEVEAKRREKADGIPYTQWAADGHIHLTPGDAVDYDYIFQTLTGVANIAISRARVEQVYKGEALASQYNIHSVAHDRWNEGQLIIKLREEGVNCRPLGQGYASLSPPTKQLEIMTTKGELVHGGNPVSRWQCSNIALARDAADNWKIDKAKSTEKVDGMAALVGAIAEYLDWAAAEKEKKSIYESRGIRFA